jgi:hypothetical protein
VNLIVEMYTYVQAKNQEVVGIGLNSSSNLSCDVDTTPARNFVKIFFYCIDNYTSYLKRWVVY